MDEPGSGGNVVRYYCTAGNGMEAFLINEVKTKLAAEDVCQIPGKVLFSSSAKINRVSNLKGAERLFLLLKQDSPVSLSAHTSTGTKAASVLQSRLLGDKNQWTSAVMTWSRLQGELTGSKNTIKTSSPALGVTRKREDEMRGSDEQSREGEKSLVEFRSTGGERKEEIDKQRSGGQNGVSTMAQKRKRDEEEEERKVAAWDTGIEKTVEKGTLSLLSFRLPLANRSYIKITGLRSTTAWAMASLPGFRVVDPMCGVGTILIEAAQEHKDACFLGVDIDEAQLQKASENIAFAELENRINLLKASSLVLPVPSATVDAVICDLPFGRKFSSRIDMAANLPLILTEMERVLRPGGILVLLLSPQLSCLLKKLLIQYDTGPTSNPETKSPSKKQTFQIHSGVKSSPSQETKLQHSLPFTVSSLKHQATFRVSLGAIDGLIHKYVKTDCCVFRDVMF
uniref:THUMP domain containing 2 n=1 Tax=Pundamilia nyererei TaxID=303518 RepID=A0A3B4FT40_9CICH